MMALRDRPLTPKEREALEGLFATLPEADRKKLMRRIRTRSQAEEWLEHISDAQVFTNIGIL